MLRSLFDRWGRQKNPARSVMGEKLAVGSGLIVLIAGVVYPLVAVRLVGQAAQAPAAAQQQASAPAATVTSRAEAVKPQPAAIQNNGTPVERQRKQMNDESADLLNLALALKAEVDKTNKDMLSLGVIRRADEIERLARTMRQNLRQ